MNIDQAIESLTIELKEGDFAHGSPYENALKLGIEALKRLKEGRQKGYDFFEHLLPRETME